MQILLSVGSLLSIAGALFVDAFNPNRLGFQPIGRLFSMHEFVAGFLSVCPFSCGKGEWNLCLSGSVYSWMLSLSNPNRALDFQQIVRLHRAAFLLCVTEGVARATPRVLGGKDADRGIGTGKMRKEL